MSEKYIEIINGNFEAFNKRIENLENTILKLLDLQTHFTEEINKSFNQHDLLWKSYNKEYFLNPKEVNKEAKSCTQILD